MCQINPDHKNNAMYRNWQNTFYMLVLRSIYGCIESALQWYKLYSEKLMKKVFELNPYDRCVANKMVNGKHCTYVWYLDNNKLLHVEEKLVEDLTNYLKKHFGELVVTITLCWIPQNTVLKLLIAHHRN